MKVDVNDIKKIVLLWKSTSEKNQPIPDEIQGQLDMYRNKKYRVNNYAFRFRRSV